MYRKLKIEINKENIQNNIKNLINELNYKYYIGVVKGNFYGHGTGLTKTMEKSGINYFAVSNLDEAIALRGETNLPILILEPIDYKYFDIACKNNITLTINSKEYYDLIKEYKEKIKVHLKIDSGLNRLGIKNKDDVDYIVSDIKNTNLYLEGIYTHFATSGILDKQYDIQLSRFKELTSNIDLNNIDIVHIDRSATALAHEKNSITNGVRLGISMYGFNPIPYIPNTFMNRLRNIKRNHIKKKLNISETNEYKNLNLKEAFTLKTGILEIKDVESGEHIGYGTKVIANENIKVAIIDVGYMDGISKKRSNSKVEINNKLYDFIGDIGMTMSIIKIDDSVKLDDEVILIGDKVSIKYVASVLNTSVYEVTNMLDSSILKEYR